MNILPQILHNAIAFLLQILNNVIPFYRSLSFDVQLALSVLITLALAAIFLAWDNHNLYRGQP